MPFLRLPRVEYANGNGRAACTDDENIVSATCLTKAGRVGNLVLDTERNAATCSRATLHLVCGKKSIFAPP